MVDVQRVLGGRDPRVVLMQLFASVGALAAAVADIVYVPLQTPLLAAAAAQGLRTVDGLGMLLHQAVSGFQRWFGVTPEVNALGVAFLVLAGLAALLGWWALRRAALLTDLGDAELTWEEQA